MNLQIFCFVDKARNLDDSNQFFVVSSSLNEAIKAFKLSIAAPHSCYNPHSKRASIKTKLTSDPNFERGCWEKVGYLDLRVNQNIPKKLPIFVRDLKPNLVFH